MRILNQRNIQNTLFAYGSLISLITVMLVLSFWVFTEVINFRKQSQQIRDEYISSKKQELTRNTNKIVDFINMSRTDLESTLRNELKSRVNEAHAIATNIYEKNRHKSQTEIQYLIKESLRPIRFFNDRGYYFIATLDGIEVLFPTQPELEGENLIDLQDSKGRFVIRDEIKIIRNQGEGFIIDHWTKPNSESEMIYPKTSYIKEFDIFNWYIGCGEYLDNFEQDAQYRILNQIKKFPINGISELFIINFNGTALTNLRNLFNESDDITFLEDLDGKNIFLEKLKLVTEKGTGFITYNTAGETHIESYITYLHAYTDWKWIIGSRISTNVPENVIEENRETLKKHIIQQAIQMAVTLVVLLIIMMLLSLLISKRIEYNFEKFSRTLEFSLKNSSQINKKHFNYQEFDTLVTRVNQIIHDKKTLEKELSESNKKFRTIFENAPVMLNIKTASGKIILANKEMERQTGYKNDELYKRTDPLSLFYPDAGEYRRAMQEILVANGKFKEFKSVANDGKTRIQRWANFKTDDHIIGVGYDITEIREKEKQLRKSQHELQEANATKNKFFSIIAHDLKNPFNVMLGFVQLLRKNYHKYDDEKRMLFLTQIESLTEETFKLTENLLLWARTQTKRINFNPGQVKVRELIYETFRMHREILAQKNIRVEINIDNTLMAHADENMFQTVIMNLFTNAIKFTPNGGIIKIEAEELSSDIRIGITDNGVGIDLADQEKLFKVGELVQSQGTNKERGTGLGLIISKEFVELNKGRLWVESIPGRGSTFYFTVQKA